MTVIINGSTGIDTVQDGIVTDAKLNLTANSQEIKDAINAGGDAPIYACRAWVNFNGTGTVAIRGSGNVSSITDIQVGFYFVNFTTAMPGNNYSAVATCMNQEGQNFSGNIAMGDSIHSTTTVAFFTSNFSGTAFDPSFVDVAVFR